MDGWRRQRPLGSPIQGMTIVNKKTFDEGVRSTKFAKNKIDFTVNVFDDSDDILSILQVVYIAAESCLRARAD